MRPFKPVGGGSSCGATGPCWLSRWDKPIPGAIVANLYAFIGIPWVKKSFIYPTLINGYKWVYRLQVFRLPFTNLYVIMVVTSQHSGWKVNARLKDEKFEKELYHAISISKIYLKVSSCHPKIGYTCMIQCMQCICNFPCLLTSSSEPL